MTNEKWFTGMTYDEAIEVLNFHADICIALAMAGQDKESQAQYGLFKGLFQELRSHIVDDKAYWYINKSEYAKVCDFDYKLCAVKHNLGMKLMDIYMGVAN